MDRSTYRRFIRGLAVAGPLVVAACSDAPTAPEALWVATETEAALDVSGALPTLPRLVQAVAEGGADAGTVSALYRAEALWREAQATPGPAADTLREAAYRIAVPLLAKTVDGARLQAALQAAEQWVAVASRAVEGRRAPQIQARLDEGRRWVARARSAEAAGRRRAALAATVRATDALSRVTPRAVALRLIRTAEATRADWLASRPRPARRESRRLKRAERLLQGAHQAVAEADYVRAIQRAYYAGQLLRGR